MSGPGEIDPTLAELASRVDRLRLELDRFDEHVLTLPAGSLRDALDQWALMIRGVLDRIDRRLERSAALG